MAPRTGRTHQIRVHLADLGHPLVGDRVYGRRYPVASHDESIGGLVAGFPRHALHAATLSFDPVRGGARVSFSAPLADDMADLIQQLRAHSVTRSSIQKSSFTPMGLTRLGV